MDDPGCTGVGCFVIPLGVGCWGSWVSPSLLPAFCPWAGLLGPWVPLPFGLLAEALGPLVGFLGVPSLLAAGWALRPLLGPWVSPPFWHVVGPLGLSPWLAIGFHLSPVTKGYMKQK